MIAVLAAALTGCESARFGPYVSPRVVGRVVTADTRQPLEGVEVRRGRGEPRPKAGWSPKGAELLMRKGPVRTGHDGEFSLGSERVLALISWAGWSTVRLTFERPGCERFQTNYTMANLLTNTPGDEPVLDAGVVLMRPGIKTRPQDHNASAQ
ncbi:MAG TPA: hypothetical protein VN578_15435 [Candidatus Binatia bacterium]|nr:hypothetical protein [Candidatus Binatia bacterium]